MKFPQTENLVGRARRSERKTKEVKKNRQKKKNEKEEGNVINRLSFILFLCIILMCICSMYNIHIEIRVYRVYETHLFGRLIFCCLIFENKKKNLRYFENTDRQSDTVRIFLRFACCFGCQCFSTSC